ncbi:hypothetical protein RHMOL_Rhmol11G0168600 [Rhododendron molle]|uniref:Uncharacterized protein n=1 Tax=Rhododendron molle TaxID=49168 RepID=A0ACC0LT74_RHOML|nr:hypothetical protein RHMOL_Rhmol11G0168600 [Rhododendron molle]
MGVKRTENLGHLSKFNPAGIGPRAVRFESSSSANLKAFKSYAQSLVGDTARKETEEGLKFSDQRSRKVSLKSAGNGWLYRIWRSKFNFTGDNIEIKAMGGRFVILTCTSMEEWRKWLKKTVFKGGSLKLNLGMDKRRALKDLCGYVTIEYHLMDGVILFSNLLENYGDESMLKMSSFAVAKILITTSIFKNIDEWIIVEAEDKSYKV